MKFELKNLKDIEGKEIIMCPKCNSQVSTLEENTICKKCSDYDYVTGTYNNLVRHQKFIIDINTMEKQVISTMNIKSIQGIPFTRIRELIGLFMLQNFNIRKDEDWKELKRHFFNIIEEDSNDK